MEINSKSGVKMGSPRGLLFRRDEEYKYKLLSPSTRGVNSLWVERKRSVLHLIMLTALGGFFALAALRYTFTQFIHH